MVERANTHKSDRFAEPEADHAEVEAGWSDAVAIHETQVGLKRELQAAEQAWTTDPSEETWQRIAEIQGRLSQAAEAEAVPYG
jgi:DNA primase